MLDDDVILLFLCTEMQQSW